MSFCLYRDGCLKVGDEILAVNGKSMKGLTQDEAVAILKATEKTVQLVVCRLLVSVEWDGPSICVLFVTNEI